MTPFPSAEGQALRRRSGESWGGRALVLLGLSVIVSDLLFRIVDHARQSYEDGDVRVIVSAGHTGRDIGLFVMACAVGCGVAGIFKGRRLDLKPAYVLLIASLTLWWLIGTAVRGDITDRNTFLGGIAALIVLIAVLADPPTLNTVRSFATLLDVGVVGGLAYGLAFPDQQLACRSDKCGLFGSLFTGYMFQENAAARFVVLLLPAAAAIRSRVHLAATLSLAGLFVLATDSRTSEVSYVLGLIMIFWLRPRLARGEDVDLRIPAVFRLLPLVCLVSSLWVFLTASGSELTGRGAVYSVLRGTLSSGVGLVFGPGSNVVDNIVLDHGYVVFGAHGQASMLLVYAGVPGLVLFGAALLSLCVIRTWRRGEAVGLAFLVVAATQFVTEPVWELNPRAMPFSLMLLSFGLFVSARSVEAAPATLARSSAIPTLMSEATWLYEDWISLLAVGVGAIITTAGLLLLLSP